MSSIGFDTAHHYKGDMLSFPNHFYHDRNDPFDQPFTGRLDPRGFALGELAGSNRERIGYGYDSPLIEQGPARRRIAIAVSGAPRQTYFLLQEPPDLDLAPVQTLLNKCTDTADDMHQCARCRKRKIRCSGDPGDGSGCSNCRGAGLAPNQCLFHRVGSDHVHKVVESFNTAQSLTGMANHEPVSPAYGHPDPKHGRSTTASCPEVELKPTYQSTWTMPFPDETSPINTYGNEQVSSAYARSPKWMLPQSMKPAHDTSNAYLNRAHPSASDVSYLGFNAQSATISEIQSPLSTNSLHSSLPDRSHRNVLPVPNPVPVRSSRNAVDEMQQQRLRSEPSLGNSSSNSGSFGRSLSSWTSNGAIMPVTCTTTSEAPLQSAQTTDGTFTFNPTPMSISGNVTSTNAPSGLQLNFTNSGLMEAMTTLAPVTGYSNFRQSRSEETTDYKPRRHDSHANIYNLSADNFYECTSPRRTPRVEPLQSQPIDRKPIPRTSMGDFASRL